MQRLSTPATFIASTLLSACGSLVLSDPSRAADLGPPLYAPPPVLTPFSWTGAYVGVGLGGDIGGRVTSRINGNDSVLQSNIRGGIRPAGGTISGRSFSGGGQIGYNYQMSAYGVLGSLSKLSGFEGGGLVLGVEADFGSDDISGHATFTSDRTSLFNANTSSIGTARGRIGYAFGTVLVYGSGGFAYGKVASSSSFLGLDGNQTYHGSVDAIGTGYAFGGGVELAVPMQSFVKMLGNGAVTVRLDYLHYDLGVGSYTVANNFSLDPGYTQSVRASGNLVRAGLNYKFDLFAAREAAVVARY